MKVLTQYVVENVNYNIVLKAFEQCPVGIFQTKENAERYARFLNDLDPYAENGYYKVVPTVYFPL